MKKTEYEAATLLITELADADIVTASGLLHVDPDEGSWV